MATATDRQHDRELLVERRVVRRSYAPMRSLTIRSRTSGTHDLKIFRSLAPNAADAYYAISRVVDDELRQRYADAYRVFRKALTDGVEVMVLPVTDDGITSQQAADILNVSRPYVVKLARSGELPFHMVGTHHRFALDDVMNHRDEAAKRRSIALDQLAELGRLQGGDF